MRRMRIRAVLFVAFFLLLPAPAAADFVSMGPSSSCPKGTAGDPSGPSKSFGLSSPATEIRSYLNRRVLCPSACFDEAVTLNVAMTGITVTVAAQNKCKKTELDPQAQDAKKDNRGCANGQTHPKVVVKITGLKEQLIPAKSRCDVSNLTRVINSVAEQRLSDALAGLDALAQPAVGVAVIAPVNLDTPTGQKVIAEQLATAFQITPEQAQTIVTKDPEAAIRAIYAVSQGNDEAIKAEAAALGLNPDLTNKVALRTMLIRDGNLTEPDPVDTLDISARSTFRNVGDFTQQVLPRDVLYSGEGTCYAVSNSYGTFRPCVLTQAQVSQVQGNVIPQVASVYWEGSRTANGEAFNPNGLTVASQTIPFGTQVLIYNPNTGLGVVATVNDRGPFVSGRDIDLSTGTANAIGFNGVGTVHTVVLGSSMPTGSLGRFSSIADAFQAYQQSNGAIAVGDGDIAPTASRNTSPFAGLFSPSTVGYANTGSPFAQASPASIAQSNTQSTAPIQTSQQIQLAQNPNQSSSVAEQLQQALGNATSTASSAIAIVVAQPKEVARGNPISVAWSSVGMSTETPCVLRAGGVEIAQKNQGSSIVPTSQATRLGSLIFTLECTSSSGAAIRRTAATFVH